MASLTRELLRWLPFPFMVIGSALLIANALILPGGLGIDAHIYYRGAAAWLSGQNPWLASWSVGPGLYHFAAPPWTLPLLLPLAALPEDWAVPILIGMSGLAAGVILRRSRLPLRWLIFPPLVQGVINGNPILVCLVLVLLGLGSAGVLVRPQLTWILVAERRWRALAIAGAIALLAMLVTPVAMFVDMLPQVVSRYVDQANGGATGGAPLALLAGVAAVGALARIDLRAAGWLATIVAWPLNGWYAGVAALPFLSPVLALSLALPVVGAPVVGVVAFVIARLIVERAPGRAHPVIRTLIEPYAR